MKVYIVRHFQMFRNIRAHSTYACIFLATRSRSDIQTNEQKTDRQKTAKHGWARRIQYTHL